MEDHFCTTWTTDRQCFLGSLSILEVASKDSVYCRERMLFFCYSFQCFSILCASKVYISSSLFLSPYNVMELSNKAKESRKELERWILQCSICCAMDTTYQISLSYHSTATTFLLQPSFLWSLASGFSWSGGCFELPEPLPKPIWGVSGKTKLS